MFVQNDHVRTSGNFILLSRLIYLMEKTYISSKQVNMTCVMFRKRSFRVLAGSPNEL